MPSRIHSFGRPDSPFIASSCKAFSNPRPSASRPYARLPCPARRAMPELSLHCAVWQNDFCRSYPYEARKAPRSSRRCRAVSDLCAGAIPETGAAALGLTRARWGKERPQMITVAIQIAVVVLLTLLNGLFAISETALVSSRKARLKQRAEGGDGGAATALALAEEPTRFLSTVQIGISLIGVLAGAFGGATLAEPLAGVLGTVPLLAPYAAPISFAIVVAAITYLSLIIGELVPKRLALNNPEAVASRMAGPMRFLSVLSAPVVWILAVSTEAVARLIGARRSDEPPVTEGEVESLLEEGARAGVFEEAERDLVERALRLDDRPVRELMTPRPKMVWLDVEDPPEEHRRVVAESRHSYYPVARGDLDELSGLASAKDAGARALGGEPRTFWGRCDSRRSSPRAPRRPPP
ncbi:MAG: hypothetical protein CYG60_08675 [Actinobacteria bacterium]|nr:MAG: hypothetical protein CYG60_08675 [Actinomycetota bacterium]